ncbi:hypothetical protein VPH35_050721 [Triticum aestivum]
MTSSLQPWALLLVLLLSSVLSLGAPATVFNENFMSVWRADGYHLANQGTQVSLTMDRNSGAGFRSKMMYGSGLFHMRIKLPAKYTTGVVTAFYLMTKPEYGDHDEVDFEFLGNVDGKPAALQTNIFLNGQGYREQKFYLCFDPVAAIHDYKILLNQHQLVMLVDEKPIRVLKDLAGCMPDGSPWATDNGKIKVDWNCAPFTSAFQRFNVDACPATGGAPCGSPNLWWNKFWDLSPRKYMTYNYYENKERINYHLPVECSYN